MQLPDAASLERTQEVIKLIDAILKGTPGVRDWVSLCGFSMLDGTNASNAATIFAIMDPWEERTLGTQTILRYNLFPAASITGSAAPGFSSGQVLNLMERMADAKLPASMGYEWTGMSYQEKKVGSEAILVFALAITLVFLVLAAQYESWSAPAAVILVVPLVVLGTIIALLMRGRLAVRPSVPRWWAV